MNDLFSWAALGTVAGASAATLLTANVIGRLLGPNSDKARNRQPTQATPGQLAQGRQPRFVRSWV
ncbi:hypothetical protein ACWCHM_10370 [Micromonospora sp. SCSIO 07396]